MYQIPERKAKISLISYLSISMFRLLLRSIGFGFGCYIAWIATIGIASAASGGLFGDILAKMLGITPAQVLTYTGDGTVANANRLSGSLATSFQKVAPNQSCGGTKCMYGFNGENILCR